MRNSAPLLALLLVLPACTSSPDADPEPEVGREEVGRRWVGEPGPLARFGLAGVRLVTAIHEFRGAEGRWPGSFTEIAGRLTAEERDLLAGLVSFELTAFSDEKATYELLWEGANQGTAEGTFTIDLEPDRGKETGE